MNRIMKIVSDLFRLTNDIISSIRNRADKDSAIEQARELRRAFDKAMKGIKIIDQDSDVRQESERVRLAEIMRPMIFTIMDNANSEMFPAERTAWGKTMEGLATLAEIYHKRGYQVWTH